MRRTDGDGRAFAATSFKPLTVEVCYLVGCSTMPRSKACPAELEVAQEIHRLQKQIRRDRLKGIINLVLEDEITLLRAELVRLKQLRN